MSVIKTVYFVRHGQSRGNRSLWIQQVAETPLSSVGHVQAERAATHIAKLHPQILIASTYERARLTAEHISEKTNLPIEFSELFVERRRPSVQLLKRKLHPQWLLAQLLRMRNRNREGYRHTDEENFDDMKERAGSALTFLESKSETTIVVVTHSVFMRMLYARMSIGENMTLREYIKFVQPLRMHNTSLMKAEFDGKQWEIKAWNVDASTL